MVPRLLAEWGVSGIDGPRPAATYQEIQGKQGLRNKETEQILTRRWAVDPANFNRFRFVFCCFCCFLSFLCFFGDKNKIRFGCA